MRTDVGRCLGALLLLTVGWVPGGFAQKNSDCFDCHADNTLKGANARSVYVDEHRLAGSIHAKLLCVDCHASLNGKELPHDDKLPPAQCATCHASAVTAYTGSAHEHPPKTGVKGTACRDCHGTHEIQRATSGPNKLDPAVLCVKCHTTAAARARFPDRIHKERHDREGLKSTPTCLSCHGPHGVRGPSDPKSPVNRRNVREVCVTCHSKPEETHRDIIPAEKWAAARRTGQQVSCIDCHQPHPDANAAGGHSATGGEACLSCHADANLKSKDGRSMAVNTPELDHSRHGALACTACHMGTSAGHDRPCQTAVKTVDCSSCHADVSRKYLKSTHGKLITANDPNGPKCTECHGTHGVLGKDDPQSQTFPLNIPTLCAKCHREGQKAAMRYTGEQHQIIEHYTESIHGRGLNKSGLIVTATCTACHTAHSVLPKTDTLSTVNPRNIPATCGQCHVGIQEKYVESIHGQAGLRGQRAPVCNDCHSSHTIRRTDEAGFRLEIMEQCGTCHKQIAETYFESYHGKVSQLGYTKTAKCYDCHGAHDIQPGSDPRSLLSKANVLRTCRKCHPGANENFTGYLTHATHKDAKTNPPLFWTFWSMTTLLVTTFFVSGLHTLLWFIRAAKIKRAQANGGKA